MAQATWWWVAAGIAVAVELGTGTFYLLMIAVGLAAGALAAHAGAAEPLQFVVAAAVGGGAVAAWHLTQGRKAHRPTTRSDPDVNPDIGELVHVDAWEADGSASVQYRGSTWTARLQPGAAAQPGEHRVAAVEGNWLVLAPNSSH